jgi:hypothetical protein
MFLAVEDKRWPGVFRLAENPNTPVDTLTALCNHSNYDNGLYAILRFVLAGNVSMPLEALESLTTDPNPATATRAINNLHAQQQRKAKIS